MRLSRYLPLFSGGEAEPTQLPFTHDQFLDVFGLYNRALWPAAGLLWLATLVAVVRWLKTPTARSDSLSLLLAIHWAWSGLVYHLAFFREINPAASWFALLFALEAAFFLWFGPVRHRAVFGPARGVRLAITLALVWYALAYPALGLVLGLSYPRAPSFGVPCPTAILTVGLLLTLRPRELRMLGVIPLLWTAVGGSAAFLLGIRADLVLALSGLILLAAMVAPGALGWQGVAGASE